MFKLQAQNFYEVIADNAKGQIIEIGRARTVYKGLYNWPKETLGKQHKQCPYS